MWKFSRHGWTFGGKAQFFTTPPAGKWFGPRIFVPRNFLKKLISAIFDSFHGGESPSYDFFFSVTEGQNANTELITIMFARHLNFKMGNDTFVGISHTNCLDQFKEMAGHVWLYTPHYAQFWIKQFDDRSRNVCLHFKTTWQVGKVTSKQFKYYAFRSLFLTKTLSIRTK